MRENIQINLPDYPITAKAINRWIKFVKKNSDAIIVSITLRFEPNKVRVWLDDDKRKNWYKNNFWLDDGTELPINRAMRK